MVIAKPYTLKIGGGGGSWKKLVKIVEACKNGAKNQDVEFAVTL